MVNTDLRAVKATYQGFLLLLFIAIAAGCLSSNEKQVDEGIELQGHRGARGLYPENSIPGFLHTLDLGVTTLEMDVVISKDRQVVVSHDHWFNAAICLQPDGQTIPPEREREILLFDMDYEEIAQYDCGSIRHPDFPRQQPERVSKPLLRDAILVAEQHAAEHGLRPVHYNVEIKSHPDRDGIAHPPPEEFVPLVLDVLEETGVKDRANLQSFDPRNLQVARSLDPTLLLALLVDYEENHSLDFHLDRLGFVPQIYSPNYRLVDEALVRDVHERGMKLIPWTVNTLEEMERLIALGVDGIITDYPDLGKDLRKR